MVPKRIGTFFYRLEIPAIVFLLQVVPRVFEAGVGNAHPHRNQVVRGGIEGKNRAGTGGFGRWRAVNFVAHPGLRRFERARELSGEIDFIMLA